MSTETVSKKRFTVDEFQRMWDARILPEDGRFELIRGEIIEMPLPGPPHSGRVSRLTRLLILGLGESAIVNVQSALWLDLHSLPLPDLTVVRAREDFYETGYPRPQDALFVVEVSHTTVSYDANVKAPLYAEAGIPEYWQVDIKKDILIVRTDPKNGEYHSVRILRRGQAIRPHELDVEFLVDDILGSAPPTE